MNFLTHWNRVTVGSMKPTDSEFFLNHWTRWLIGCYGKTLSKTLACFSEFPQAGSSVRWFQTSQDFCPPSTPVFLLRPTFGTSCFLWAPLVWRCVGFPVVTAQAIPKGSGAPTRWAGTGLLSAGSSLGIFLTGSKASSVCFSRGRGES